MAACLELRGFLRLGTCSIKSRKLSGKTNQADHMILDLNADLLDPEHRGQERTGFEIITAHRSPLPCSESMLYELGVEAHTHSLSTPEAELLD